MSLLISLFTLLVYTGVSFRLAFAQRMRNALKKSRHNPEAKGWLSKWVPYVSNLAWSTLDLCNLYVSKIQMFYFRLSNKRTSEVSHSVHLLSIQIDTKHLE